MDNQNNNGYSTKTEDDLFIQYDPIPQENPYEQQQMGYNPYNQPMNNQYPNQYDPNMNQQPVYQNPNRGGGVFSLILAILLLAGLVIFLLDYTGTVDIKGLFNKEKTEEKKDEEKIDDSEKAVSYEEELIVMCNEMNTEGSLRPEELEDLNNELDILFEPTIDEMWKVVQGHSYCNNHICFIYPKGDNQYVYQYSCPTNKYKKWSYKEFVNNGSVEIALQTLCNQIDSQGNYVDSDGNIFCQSGVCAIESEGKQHTKVCQN